MNKPREVKIICPKCHGTGQHCEGNHYIGLAPSMCRGKGWIKAQEWNEPQKEE